MREALGGQAGWNPGRDRAARTDWLSALDGMWPAVEAKLGAKIVEREPAASPMAVRAPPWIPCAPS